jgi:hypothetical protein
MTAHISAGKRKNCSDSDLQTRVAITEHKILEEEAEKIKLQEAEMQRTKENMLLLKNDQEKNIHRQRFIENLNIIIGQYENGKNQLREQKKNKLREAIHTHNFLEKISPQKQTNIILSNKLPSSCKAISIWSGCANCQNLESNLCLAERLQMSQQSSLLIKNNIGIKSKRRKRKKTKKTQLHCGDVKEKILPSSCTIQPTTSQCSTLPPFSKNEDIKNLPQKMMSAAAQNSVIGAMMSQQQHRISLSAPAADYLPIQNIQAGQLCHFSPALWFPPKQCLWTMPSSSHLLQDALKEQVGILQEEESFMNIV